MLLPHKTHCIDSKSILFINLKPTQKKGDNKKRDNGNKVLEAEMQMSKR